MGKSILIVDDEPLIASSLAKLFAAEGLETQVASSGRAALELVERNPPDAMILDLVLGDMDGLEVLRRLRERDAVSPKVILLTAHGSVDSAVAAMKAGADDFIKKPFELDAVLSAVRAALRTQSLEARVRYLESDRRGQTHLFGESKATRLLREQVKTVARSPVPVVLLLGESGTGKGVAARMLHEQSERALGPFVEVNCAAIPEAQLEAELFGFERGALPDARQRREGMVEVADGGTLFLDEIGALPLSLQANLLKFVEDRSFRRVGSNRVLRVDARIVASTNQDLRARALDGRFRADLFYRLSEMVIRLPPLRERLDDVVPLGRHFLDDAARRNGRRFRGFTAEAEALLRGYRWPGNVRELRAVVNRVALMQDGEQLTASQLPPEIAASHALEEPALPSTPGTGPIPTLAEVEVAYIRRVLALCDGNKLLASRYLGIARQTLARRLQEAGAPPPTPERDPE